MYIYISIYAIDWYKTEGADGEEKKKYKADTQMHHTTIVAFQNVGKQIC